MNFGVSQPFECSYLPNKTERLLVFVDNTSSSALYYPELIQAGFRRSGEQIYRPYCEQCQACQSLRIPVNSFKPSRSQRRLLKKNIHFSIRLSHSSSSTYYPLYAKYINQRHADGGMYPPSPEQLASFIHCSWASPLFIEAYDNHTLIGVAVTDTVNSVTGHKGLSAMYTFFDPDYESHSLGTWMILSQIEVVKAQQQDYLYLGYQIDDCAKMNYKNAYFPHERYVKHQWIRINTKNEITTTAQDNA